MKKLMMMLGILLAMPLFAADTPATLDTLRDQIASLTTTVNAMKQKIDDLRLGGAVGDIGAVKDTVTNQGVQVVRVDVSHTLVGSDRSKVMTKWSPVSTYQDHGGSIPGVVVHASNGITLPAGTYLFRTDVYAGSLESPPDTMTGNGTSGARPANVVPSAPRSVAYSWWRWTGEGGHATGRVGGDVVWPMNRLAVFTFASATTIKVHTPNWEIRNGNLYQDVVVDGKSVSPSRQFSAIVERL